MAAGGDLSGVRDELTDPGEPARAVVFSCAVTLAGPLLPKRAGEEYPQTSLIVSD